MIQILVPLLIGYILMGAFYAQCKVRAVSVILGESISLRVFLLMLLMWPYEAYNVLTQLQVDLIIRKLEARNKESDKDTLN